MSAQRLTTRFIGALVLIALVLLGSLLLLYSSLEQQSVDAHLINTAGRQRTLAVQIGVTANRLVRAADSTSRAGERAMLATLLSRWQVVAQSLLAGNPDLGILPPSADARQALLDMQPDYERMRAAAERLLPNDAAPQTLQAAAAEIEAILPMYIAGIDSVVLVYEREAAAKVEQTQQQSLLIFTLNGVLLIVIGVAVFRPMVHQIYTTISALRQSDERTEATAQELARQNARLDLALLEARAASHARGRFLTAINHEIRTPLNAVIGMSDLLRETTLTAEQREYVETIRSSGDTLLAITNDVLDFIQIDAGRITLNHQPFSVIACVETVLERLAFRSARKRIDLLYSLASSLPATLIGDEPRLRQILTNLLDNAIRHTDCGEIEMAISGHPITPDTYELQIGVRDTGSGIPPDRIDHLFDAFNQDDAVPGQPHHGLGLGLAISRRLCELMGGRLTVASAPGEGATFVVVVQVGMQASAALPDDSAFLQGRHILVLNDNAAMRQVLHDLLIGMGAMVTLASDRASLLTAITRVRDLDLALIDLSLPGIDALVFLHELHARAPHMPMVLMAFTGDEGVWHYTQLPNVAAVLFKPVFPVQLRATLRRALQPAYRTPVEQATRLRAAPFLGAPLRILMAEDNESNQKVALRMLERLGYHADIADDGLAALAMLRQREYDVVLMDVQMPEMDGLEVTRTLIAETPPDHRPWIIALTAGALPGDREAYLEAGMDDYIVKPVQFTDLISALIRVPPLQLPPEWFLRQSEAQFDQGRIQALRDALGGNVVNDLIRHYLEEAPVLIATMRRACEQADRKGFHRAAHTLKASSAMFGLLGLSQLCADLERQSKQAIPEHAALQLVHADQLLHEVGYWLVGSHVET